MSYRIRKISGVISTDDIIPGRYKHMYSDPKDLAPHIFEGRFPGIADTFAPGDAIWCSDTFGIGSSREQAATSLLAAGVELVLAPQFGRIFFRNAWNVGLRLISLAPPEALLEGTVIEADWSAGVLTGETWKRPFAPPARRILEIADAGGLLAWVKQTIPAQVGAA